jgi:hypothetical protein
VTVEWIGPSWLRPPAETLGVRIFFRSTKLSLSGPAYTDAAVEHIVRLRDLAQLDLSRTKITDEGLARLKRSLPECRIVQVADSQPN